MIVIEIKEISTRLRTKSLGHLPGILKITQVLHEYEDNKARIWVAWYVSNWCVAYLTAYWKMNKWSKGCVIIITRIVPTCTVFINTF